MKCHDSAVTAGAKLKGASLDSVYDLLVIGDNFVALAPSVSNYVLKLSPTQTFVCMQRAEFRPYSVTTPCGFQAM